LSALGRLDVDRIAAAAAARGARPDVVWHSGKLRAKQTAESYWRACNALAQFSAARGLQPGDPPQWIRDVIVAETRVVLVAGHFPHLPRLLSLLLNEERNFPPHGIVALGSDDQGQTWKESWRIESLLP
jgi:phosphohistidine phosphatase